MTERVVVYIDGFNLYHGIKHSGMRKYLWLDIYLFSQNLLSLNNQRLEKVRYFTAPIFHERKDPDKKKRQQDFLEANRVRPEVEIAYGSHRRKSIFCRMCNSSFKKPEEKMTDVNIAVKLLEDAQDNLFDTAFLVTGDEDLSSAVESVTNRYAKKQVVMYFPPGRTPKTSRLNVVASHLRSINQSVLARSQLPNIVTTRTNKVLHRPPSWT